MSIKCHKLTKDLQSFFPLPAVENPGVEEQDNTGILWLSTRLQWWSQWSQLWFFCLFFTVNPCMYISVPEPSRQNGNGPIFLEENGSNCLDAQKVLGVWTGVLRMFLYFCFGCWWRWRFTCMFVPTHRTGPCFHSPQSRRWCSKACHTAHTHTWLRNWNLIQLKGLSYCTETQLRREKE